MTNVSFSSFFLYLFLNLLNYSKKLFIKNWFWNRCLNKPIDPYTQKGKYQPNHMINVPLRSI